jgi:hypothetical protein
MSDLENELAAADAALRDQVLDILDEAVARIPAAETAIRSSASGAARAADAKQLQSDSMAFTRLIDRLDHLALPRPLKLELHGILDYHRELIGQAPLFAFGQQSERNAPQRAALAQGFGPRSAELTTLRDALLRLRSADDPSR